MCDGRENILGKNFFKSDWRAGYPSKTYIFDLYETYPWKCRDLNQIHTGCAHERKNIMGKNPIELTTIEYWNGKAFALPWTSWTCEPGKKYFHDWNDRSTFTLLCQLYAVPLEEFSCEFATTSAGVCSCYEIWDYESEFGAPKLICCCFALAVCGKIQCGPAN